MSDLSDKKEDYKQSVYNLLSQIQPLEGGGDYSGDRYDLIGLTKIKIDELMPEGETVQFEVADTDNVTDTVDIQINAFLDSAAKIVHLTAPLSYIVGKLRLGIDVNAVATVTEAPIAGGTSYVEGDVLTLVASGAIGGSVIVTTIAAGVVTAVSLKTKGSGYSVATVTTTGGTGTGCTIAIASIANVINLFDNGDGTGYVTLPIDFLRLQSFKMTDWDKEVSEAITPQHPLFIRQSNTYTRGGKSKPVCVIMNKNVSSTIKRVVQYYSLATDDTPAIDQFIYVPEVQAEDVQNTLIEALTWTCAAQVLEAQGYTEASKKAFEHSQLEYQNLK